jgi:hypothetical protein
MADDNSNTGEPDPSGVSLAEIYERRYWVDRFGVTAERLKTAVEAVGNSPDDVENGCSSMSRYQFL